MIVSGSEKTEVLIIGVDVRSVGATCEQAEIVCGREFYFTVRTAERAKGAKVRPSSQSTAWWLVSPVRFDHPLTQPRSLTPLDLPTVPPNEPSLRTM